MLRIHHSFGAACLTAVLGAVAACSSDETTSAPRVFGDGGVDATVAPPSDAPREGPDAKVTFSFGSNGRDLATSIAVTADGKVVVAGNFQGAIPFGPVTISAGATSPRDGFVAFLDEALKPQKGFAFSSGNAFLASVGDNQVAVVASLSASTQIGGSAVAALDARDVAVMAFRSNGDLQGHRIVGGPGDDEIFAMGTSGDGELALLMDGQFQLGDVDGGVALVPSVERSLITLAMGRGGPKWLSAKALGPMPWATAISKAGLVMAVATKDGVTLGEVPLSGSANPGEHGSPAFSRFSPTGVPLRSGLWSTAAGDAPLGGHVLQDDDGTVLLAASIKGPVSFGGRDVPGEGGVVVMRIQADGGVTWAKRLGGPHVPAYPKVRRDASGDLVVLSALDSGAAPMVYRLSPTGDVRAAIKLKPIAKLRELVDVAPSAGDWAVVGHTEDAAGHEDVVVVRYASL